VRRVLVIGIGAGDPEHLTVQAVAALNRTDVLLVVDKGEDGAGADLAAVRDAILERHLEPGRVPRRVHIPEIARDRTPADYQATVDAWRAARVAAYAGAIAEVGDGETAAFLVWGDPAIYDGTVSLLDELAAAGDTPFELEVLPGVSAASALAAAHRVPLNQVGESILFTTGRRLRDRGIPDSVDNVVVFLDAGETWRTLDVDADIWWGAFLATEDEVLVSGRLADVRDEIAKVRAEARDRKGWMFDTYLLRIRR
jgi:precorrin-6A synthase